ncbi:hypothetical protein BDR26DRAFT_867006 [Obelidium mucronatum]|nr:hypothetical protein BDR26DRAFT_867006 [Obelidium mucronatum]
MDSDEAYKLKYIKSLEERLVCAEKLRTEELRAAQLRQDVLVLSRQSKLLRLRLATTDREVPPAVVLSQYSAVLLEADEDDDLTGLLREEEDIQNDLIEFNQLEQDATPWHLLFRKLYPGQISHLRPHHRQLIDTAVHEEFLIPRLGRENAEKLLIRTSGAASYYAIPAVLLQDFNEWFTVKMDELIVSDEFSMKNSRRKSAPVSAAAAASVVAPTSSINKNENSRSSRRSTTIGSAEADPLQRGKNVNTNAANASKPKQGQTSATSATTTTNKPKQSQGNSGGAVTFNVPPRPMMPDGSPNAEGYRTWTDVIRSKYPTFNKSGSQMCKVAGSFCDKYKLKKIPMVAQTSFRSSKPAFSLPGKYHQEFLEYMEAAFLKPDGTFGREDAHLYPTDSAAQGEAAANVNEGDLGGDHHGDEEMYVDDGADMVWSVKQQETERRSSISSSVNNTKREEGVETTMDSVTIPQHGNTLHQDNSKSNDNALEWKACLTDTQRSFLKDNAKSTTLLLIIRNQVLDFIKTRGGGDDGRFPPGFVPSGLVPEFQAWFAEALENGFSPMGGEEEGEEQEESLPIGGQLEIAEGESVEDTAMAERMEMDGGGGILESVPSDSALLTAAGSEPIADVAVAAGAIEMGGGVGGVSSPSLKQPRRSPEVQDSVSKKMKVSENVAIATSISAAADGTTGVSVGSALDARRPSVDHQSSSKFITATGMRLTKYNSILVKLMPEFKSLSREARVAIKRGVKLFLQQEMAEKFSECMFTADGADHHTYGVPDHLLDEFKSWAVGELRRCFPDKFVAE